MQRSREAIALLITVMFVIVITVAIGFGLRLTKEATQELKTEAFIYQSNLLVEDILKILQNSPDLATIGDTNSSEALFIFLSTASFIPLQSQGVSVTISLESARAKFPLVALTPERAEFLREFVSRKNINPSYVEILLDAMSKIKEDRSYNSAIFDENPSLFRDYIATKEHLEQVNDYYARTYNENVTKNIDFEKLFSFTQDANASIDLNFANAQVWEFLLQSAPERALILEERRGFYTDIASLELSQEEQERVEKFQISFFEPILLVTLEMREDESVARVIFEYDIKKKKGSNFVYEI